VNRRCLSLERRRVAERGMRFGSLRCGAPRTVEEIALWRLIMLRRLGPSPSRGSFWLGGLFWRRVSRSQILSEDPLYGVINGHVCKRCDEHLAACRRTPPRRLPTTCRCRADPQLQGSRTAVGTAPAPATGPGPALPHGGLGSREGFAPRRLCYDSVQRVFIFV